MSAAPRFSAKSAARAPMPPFEEEAPIGMREMTAIAFRLRWRIVVALLVPPLIAVVLMVVLPKTYRAQSDIMVKTGREYMAQGDIESANLTAPSSTKQEGINSEIALLTSRAVAEAAIAEIGLEELYPALVASPPSSGSVLDAAVLEFSRNLVVEPVKLSHVIATSFDGASPAQARRVLDTVIRLYISTHTAVFAGRRAEGYRDAIEKTLAEIRTLEQLRSGIKLAGGIYDIDSQRRAIIGQRTDAETRQEEAQSKQERLKARQAYLNKARSEVAATMLVSSTERSDSQTHANDALIDLRQQEAALNHRLGNSSPELQRVRAQIDTATRATGSARKERNDTVATSPVRLQIDQEMVTTGADLATTGAEIARLTAFVAARGAELARLERADTDLRETVLQIDMMTQNLRAMQGRYEQARADEQTDIARQVSVVQVAAAIGSERPVSPKKLIFGAGGLLSGVLLAGIVTMLGILTSKTAATDEAAERRVGLPVLATVPFSKRKDAWAEMAEPAFGAR